jgi:hypothetical protein
MSWQVIVALVVMVPIILIPVFLVWFLNLNGVYAAWKARRAASKERSLESERVRSG